jgi:hypothetical protein
MITILEAVIKTSCPEKPQIIVTGAEPQNTCAMLVMMAKFAKLSEAEKANAAKGGAGEPAPEPEKPREPSISLP